MKKTLTVNLNNIVFHIDDDAYEMLQTYLADVARHLSEDEKKEVMNDIEARVAELFTERLQRNKNVVNIEDVEEIIKILGKPSQYADEDENDADASYSKSEKNGPVVSFAIPKMLFSVEWEPGLRPISLSMLPGYA